MLVRTIFSWARLTLVSRTPGTLASLRLLGGSPCLDFANTVDPRQGADARHDYLLSYTDLVRWSEHAGLIDDDIANSLDCRAAELPSAAATAYHRAMTLREAVYAVFSAAATSTEPAPADLLVIEQTLRNTSHSVRLTWNGSGADWRPVSNNPELELPLFQVANSATELLADLSMHIVKRCPGANDCGWLFLDRSKNRSRRWCSSDGCGARVKMRRHYHRSRSGHTQPPTGRVDVVTS